MAIKHDRIWDFGYANRIESNSEKFFLFARNLRAVLKQGVTAFTVLTVLTVLNSSGSSISLSAVLESATGSLCYSYKKDLQSTMV